ncbi:MAG: tRNA pseudouridine(55) synthase TruB [Pseudomonadota bacterium]
MARRRKGTPLDGWSVIDKPLGATSAQTVNAVRRALDAQKAGHAGTLDPLATGVLAVAFGEATKTIPIVQDGAKSYCFTVRFGQRTTTDDREGNVIAESPCRPTDAAISAALTSFEGEVQQVPPHFSAVKVEGARAYDLARAGAALDLAARPLTVHRIVLTGRLDADHAEIEMVCGKGGYVRAIARDLGEALGCHGHVAALRRTGTGPFTLDHAIAFDPETLTAADLLPLEAGLADLTEIAVDPVGAARLRNGQAIPSATTIDGSAWASLFGRAVALVRTSAGSLLPDRVFPERAERATPLHSIGDIDQ